MNALEQTHALLAELTAGEKAQLLQWLARDLGGAAVGIEITPHIVGGVPRIVRTRIPVWTLVQARRLGFAEADILRAYPTLRAEDLANAWAYYHAHRPEIEHQIAENETD
jgi:uncharacterized protein (DUF433 family)